MRSLILASASPRRRALLQWAGWAFEVQPAHADESLVPGEAPAVYVQRLSLHKAQSVAQTLRPGPIVIGADTTVVLEGEIIGKPADAAEAVTILRRLGGRTHEVLTGLSVLDTLTGLSQTECCRARVPMRPYTEAEIAAYVATGDPLDKAGAYAIQHSTFSPVAITEFADCCANVVGLPLCLLHQLLHNWGLTPPRPLPAACQPNPQVPCPLLPDLLQQADNNFSAEHTPTQS